MYTNIEAAISTIGFQYFRLPGNVAAFVLRDETVDSKKSV
jgi:hypothetical protein